MNADKRRSKPQYPSAFRQALKRLIDAAIAICLLALLLPVLALVAAGIFLTMGWPIFFLQTRLGRHGIPFTLVKFRSMAQTSDAHGGFLPDEARLTRFGRFVRQHSLDELPQLWNVARGEMSLGWSPASARPVHGSL
jgi:sugar transferase EpsL